MGGRILAQVDRDGIATVTLNRPEAHNAFDPEMVMELTACLRELGAGSEVRAVVLRGAGASFCAGADIGHMKRSASFAEEQNFRDAQAAARMFHALHTLGKPTVAAVRGAVRGGGVGLVAACDVAIAARAATFRLSEVKLGLIPAVISPYVVAAIGERTARRYMLTGEEFGAAEAAGMGLVHEVVGETELDAGLGRLLAHLQSSGPAAMAAIKALLPASARLRYDEAIVDETARRLAAIRATPEAQEGLAAFLEKREPSWVAAATSRGAPRHG